MISAIRAALFGTARFLALICVMTCAACSGNPPTPSPLGTTEAQDVLTPTPKLTPSPTPMSEATAVATPVSEPTVSGFEHFIPMGFQGIELAAQSIYGGEIRVVGSAVPTWTRLPMPSNGLWTLRGWSPDGCHLVVVGDYPIGLVSWDGSIERIVFREREFAPGEHRSGTTLSPDNTWVAYIVGSGQQEYLGYEWQDVETASVGNDSSPIYRLTTAGRTWKPAWSPVTNMLAYGDANETGAPVLVISSPTGENRTVLFVSNDKNGEIREVRWSPTGDMIAFEVLDGQENQQVWLASIHGESEPLIMDDVVGIRDFWWQDAQTLGVYGTPRNSDTDLYVGSSVFWYDTVDLVQVGRLVPGSTFGQEIIQPSPLDAVRIGFFSADKFIAYDIPNGESTTLYPWYEDGVRWYLRPHGPGTGDCL